MSNLRDRIQREIDRGNLGERFTAQDIRNLILKNGGLLGGHAAPKSLNSALANSSVGPEQRKGVAVKKGGKPLFRRHATAEYSLYNTESAAYPTLTRQPAPEAHKSPTVALVKPGRKKADLAVNQVTRPFKSSERQRIASLFVDYLRNKPYRRLEVTKSRLTWDEDVCVGWNARLHAYKWNRNKDDWKSTEAKLLKFANDLRQLENKADRSTRTGEAERIYESIRKWGNPAGTALSGSQVIARLDPLWRGKVITAVDSTLTKLYALARPSDYLIHDSRVAAAIISIAEDIFRRADQDKKQIDRILEFQEAYPNLGLYKEGRGGTRPRAVRSKRWPNAYRKVAAQLEANDLGQRIRDLLIAKKEDGRSNWTLREVEAVLFMEGY